MMDPLNSAFPATPRALCSTGHLTVASACTWEMIARGDTAADESATRAEERSFEITIDGYDALSRLRFGCPRLFGASLPLSPLVRDSWRVERRCGMWHPTARPSCASELCLQRAVLAHPLTRLCVGAGGGGTGEIEPSRCKHRVLDNKVVVTMFKALDSVVSTRKWRALK
jgi:hypothetical protein